MANALTAELNLNIKKFTAALNRAERNAKSFGQKGGRASGKALGNGIQGGVAGAMKKVAANITKTMAAVAAAAGLLFARIIQRSTQEAGKMEAAEMRFNILTGDAEKSAKVLRVLRQTAMKTGITFEAMAGNVGKFMAFGFSPEKAMELNKGILDVGGAVGMTNTDMKLLGVALSQVAAKGVGSMEELRQQIAEKGIPIFKALEKQLNVTGAELNKMIQEGKVSADVVLGLFTDVAKGKGPLKDFAGGAAKMATIFQGKIGRMKATWQEFLMRFGDPIIEALLPIMDDILIIMEGMIRNADEWGKRIAATISKLENFTDPVAKMSESIDGFERAWDAFSVYAGLTFGNHLIRGAIVAFAAIGEILNKTLFGIGNVIVEALGGGLWDVLSSLTESLQSSLAAALTGAAADFIAYLESKNPFSKMMPLFPPGAEEFMRGKSADHQVESVRQASEAMMAVKGITDHLRADQEDFNKIFEGQLQQLISNLNDPQTGLDLFGAGEARKNLQEILDSLKPRPKDPEETMGAAADSSGAPGVAAFGGPMLNGRMDQMNNAIMGRSAFSVIAMEAQKASQQRDKANGLLKEIRDAVTDDGLRSGWRKPVSIWRIRLTLYNTYITQCQTSLKQ